MAYLSQEGSRRILVIVDLDLTHTPIMKNEGNPFQKYNQKTVSLEHDRECILMPKDGGESRKVQWTMGRI